MTTTSLPCGAFEATLVRTRKRKSLGIYVQHGKVIVRAPNREPLANITAFLHHKRAWIEAHLHRQLAEQAANHHSFAIDDAFYFLGRLYPLRLAAGRPKQVELHRDCLEVKIQDISQPIKVKLALEQWYKTEALEYVTARVTLFEQRLRVASKGVSVRRYKSRWGSCNHRGELQFNWLIMMAPPEVVDYLVVHELCHLKHFNHSRAFWQLVESCLPDYRTTRAWLQQQTHIVWPNHE